MAGELSRKMPWELANTRWAAILNPVVANPLMGGQLLSGISVAAGKNVINHGLGTKLQGYIVVMNNSNVTFYDTQDTNPMPDLTLELYSAGPAVISLYVF